MQGNVSLQEGCLKKMLYNRTVQGTATAGHKETPGFWCTLLMAVEASVEVLSIG